MNKPSTLGISALVALLLSLALTLVAGGWLWALDGVRAAQGLGGWLELPMRAFTFLGDEQFYLLAIPLVYWCAHKGLGAALGFLLVLSSFANGSLKAFFKHQRPFWEDAALKLGDAGSFSLPSGHSQTSAALFGYGAWFAAGKRRGRPWAALLALLIVLVALSRVYLGVHFPGDVVWGASVGLGLAALFACLKPRLLPALARLSLGAHVLLAFLVAAAIIGLTAVPLAIPFGSGQMFSDLYTEAWGAALSDSATVAGLAFGLWIGLVLEARHVRFRVAGPAWQRVLRYLIGVAGLAAIWMGLRIIFPQDPLVLGLALRFIRYALAMLWAIAIWPWLFVRIGLGTAE